MKRVRHRRFRLQRLLHGVSACVFAHAMAVLLVLANFPAWAMPASAMSDHESRTVAHATATASAHHHCDGMTTKAAAHAQSAHRGNHGSCCANGVCVCAHVCPGALAMLLPDSAAYAAVHWSSPLDVFPIDADNERRLRPPIV